MLERTRLGAGFEGTGGAGLAKHIISTPKTSFGTLGGVFAGGVRLLGLLGTAGGAFMGGRLRMSTLFAAALPFDRGVILGLGLGATHLLEFTFGGPASERTWSGTTGSRLSAFISCDIDGVV